MNRTHPPLPLRGALAVVALVSLVACSGGGGGGTAPAPPPAAGPGITVVEPGLLAAGDQRLLLGEDPGPEAPLWMVAADRYTREGVGVLVQRDAAGAPVGFQGAVYGDGQGQGMVVLTGADGYPATVYTSDGAEVWLSNFTDSTVDVEVYYPAGNRVASETVSLGAEFADLQALIAEHGTRVAARSFATRPAPRGAAGRAAYAQNLTWTTLLFKLGTTTISVVGCVVAVPAAATVVLAGAAVVACTSAAHGIVSTLSYSFGDQGQADLFGNSSSILGAVGCVGCVGAALGADPLKILDCLSSALDAADLAVGGLSDCQPTTIRAEQSCYAGSVFWFDDCRRPTALAEDCLSGCADGACRDCAGIEVTAAAAPDCVAAGDYAFFSASVTGAPGADHAYRWNFGDGGTSGLREDSHAFPNEGMYIATLMVTDDGLACGRAATPLQVGHCQDVLTEIGLDKSCVEVGESVAFTGSIRAEAGRTYAYSWNLGDGTTSAETAVSHSYGAAGTRSVTLSVLDDQGKRGEAARTVQVGQCERDLTVEILAYRSCIPPGESLIFNTAVTGADEGALTYAWVFGDGGTSAEPLIVSHTFAEAGRYPVTVAVADAMGNTGSAAFAVQVGGCEEITLGIAASSTCAEPGENVAFTAEADGGDPASYRYLWGLGDGTESQAPAPVHAYGSAGTYTVTLAVTDEFDNRAETAAALQVGGCDTGGAEFGGKLVYTTSARVAPDAADLEMMDLATGDRWSVAALPGRVHRALGLTRAGLVVYGETDLSSGDDRLLAAANWGRNTPTPLGSDCGLDGLTWYSDDQVAVADSGDAFLHGRYREEVPDAFGRGATRVVQRHGILRIPGSGGTCLPIPMDFDGDGDTTDETYDDTDIAVSAAGDRLLFATNLGTPYRLYLVGPDGGSPTLLTDDYWGGLTLNRDGSQALFELSPEFDYHLGTMPAAGGVSLDLDAATGLVLSNTGGGVSPDGAWLAAWNIDLTTGQIHPVLIRADGSEHRILDTGAVVMATHHGIQFTPDGASLVLVGTDTGITPANADLFIIDVDGSGFTNLTRTPDRNEDAVLVR